METPKIYEIFDSLSVYEIAVLACCNPIIENNNNEKFTKIVITSKDSLIWAGAIAQIMILNRHLTRENVLDIFLATLQAEVDMDTIVGNKIFSNNYNNLDHLQTIKTFLKLAGAETQLDEVLIRTKDAIRTLELRGILIDPFFKNVRNILIGVVTLMPVNFVIEGPEYINISTLSWQYTQSIDGNKTSREFRFKVKETTEAVFDIFIPAMVSIAEKFGSTEKEMTIKDAQLRLTNLGFYTGHIDGKAGPKTISALKTFQKERDLFITGHLDKNTIDALRTQK